MKTLQPVSTSFAPFVDGRRRAPRGASDFGERAVAGPSFQRDSVTECDPPPPSSSGRPASQTGIELPHSKTSRLVETPACDAAPDSTWPKGRWWRPELVVFAALLAIFNAPLLGGSFWDSMIFRPQAVSEGEWWRLLAHPFVHATWYHLLLDGAAFFLLYLSLAERRFAGRLACVVAGGFGSLMCSWWVASAVSSGGLCGLSGIAHGLMAVSAIEMISLADSESAERRLGWVSFFLVVSKAALEAVSGRMFFTFLHFGLMGEPVAVSHAGGVVGGLSMLLLLRRARHWQPCGRRQAGLARHGLPSEPAGDEQSTHSVPCAELAVLRGGPCRG